MRVDGFVLAGGASRRMGTDKARILLDGRPMALVVADALAAVCDRVALVRRVADAWPLEVVVDPDHEGTHPLFGVAAALEAARTERVVVAPCDVPLLTPETVARLAEGPAVAWDGERVHPLVASYPRDWASRVLQAARAGRSARSLAEGLARIRVPVEELRNVNGPADLAAIGLVPQGTLRYARRPSEEGS